MTEYRHTSHNYLSRFFILIGIFLLSAIVFGYLFLFIISSIYKIPYEDLVMNTRISEGGIYLSAAKWYQITASISSFLVSAYFFLWMYRERPLEYWKIKKPIKIGLLAKTIVLVFCLIIICTVLIYFNKRIFLGDSVFAQWVTDSENQVQGMMQALLRMNSTPEMLFNLLLIAIVPAICEEVFFRGTLQRLLHSWTGNTHAAVIITSVIFAMIHLKFTQVLPIFAISLFLGYVYAYTGNLWYCIIMHLVNNALSVFAVYYGRGNKTIELLLNDDYMPNIFLVLAAIALTAYLFRNIYRNRVIEIPETHDGDSEHFTHE